MLNPVVKNDNPTMPDYPIVMRDKQERIKEQYKTDPRSAMITDHARSISANFPATQPLYGSVEIGQVNPQVLDFSLHEGVGGLGDLPVPGDLFCGAVAGCLDSILRIIANHLKIELKELEVLVEADVDLRGTLMISPSAPVGFKKIRVEVRLTAAQELPQSTFDAMLSHAERCCVILQSLQNPPLIEFFGISKKA